MTEGARMSLVDGRGGVEVSTTPNVDAIFVLPRSYNKLRC